MKKLTAIMKKLIAAIIGIPLIMCGILFIIPGRLAGRVIIGIILFIPLLIVIDWLNKKLFGTEYEEWGNNLP